MEGGYWKAKFSASSRTKQITYTYSKREINNSFLRIRHTTEQTSRPHKKKLKHIELIKHRIMKPAASPLRNPAVILQSKWHGDKNNM